MKLKIRNVESLVDSDLDYINLLEEIKSRLKISQLKAAITVNTELLNFYWNIGRLIVQKQEVTKWGDKLFEILSRDLCLAFPQTQGFSKTNLKNMRVFYNCYPNGVIGQALPDQLTWTHHMVLIKFLTSSDLQKKQWYAVQSVKNGWGYRQLQENIKLDLYSRQANQVIKTTNFNETLPSVTSNFAHEMIKDPYKFHFLTVGDDALEKEIQSGLIYHIKQFLMELGQGFAFYGANYPIYVSGKRFEIDLIFYHTKLHAYVVIELKRGEFQPQHTGQLNFYLSAIDEQLKMSEDNPTIGLLLCEKKDRVIAEYALKRVDSPIGISEYEVLKSLPKNLQQILPTIEQIESELSVFSDDSNNGELI